MKILYLISICKIFCLWSCSPKIVFNKDLLVEGRVFNETLPLDSVKVYIYFSTTSAYIDRQTTDTSYICKYGMPTKEFLDYYQIAGNYREIFGKNAEYNQTIYSNKEGKITFILPFHNLRNLQGNHNNHNRGILYDGIVLVFLKRGYKEQTIVYHPYCIETMQQLQKIKMIKIE